MVEQVDDAVAQEGIQSHDKTMQEDQRNEEPVTRNQALTKQNALDETVVVQPGKN